MADWFKLYTDVIENPKTLVAQSESPHAIAMLILLFSRAAKKQTERLAFGPLETRAAAHMLSLKIEQIESAIAALSASGHIEFDKSTVYIPGWEHHQSEYLSKRKRSRRGGEQPGPGNPPNSNATGKAAQQQATHHEPDNPTTATTDPPKAKARAGQTAEGEIYSADFLKFWEAYPQKKSKGAAWKAWKHLQRRPPLAAILKSLQNAIEITWANRQRDKIPYPATWLNARGFEDEISAEDEMDLSDLPAEDQERSRYLLKCLRDEDERLALEAEAQ